MAVSANTLFHFTKSESLKQILKSKMFLTNYSLEHFDEIFTKESAYHRAYVPLISFCDLTITQLSQISRHTEDFGKYGIGLRKEWGEKNGVSPVIYVHKQSHPSRNINKLIKVFNSLSNRFSNERAFSTIKLKLADFIKFLKPYKGYWQKGQKSDKIIRYYDEREWRFCPPYPQYKVLPFKKNKDSSLRTIKLKRKAKLTFTPDDIKFIIIEKQAEIQEFSNSIDRMKISTRKKNELKTKIITFEEIREDF